MARLAVAVAVVCAGITLVSCGTGQPAGPPAPPAPPTVETSAAATVPEQLRFTAKTVDGKDFSGESLLGKPAVLWFWTPWCPRCQGESEDIGKAAKETEGSVQFIGVAAQDEVPAMLAFVERFGLGSFPHLADTDSAVWQRFGIVEQPAYAFVEADGTVEVVTRQLYREDLREKVRGMASRG